MYVMYVMLNIHVTA